MLVPVVALGIDDVHLPGQLASENAMDLRAGQTWYRKTAERLRKNKQACSLGGLLATDKEGGLQASKSYDHDEMVEALTMPSTGTLGLETEFEQVLSMYDQSYQCLIEDLVKRQSGTGTVNSATVYAEWDRLGKLEGKLMSLVGGLSGQSSATVGADQAVQTELNAKRQHLLTLSDTLLSPALPAPSSGSATVGATPSTAASGSSTRSGGTFLSTNLGAKAESTGLYARMFYTRLIFWIILAVMLVIAIIHAYTASETSLALNAIVVMVALILLYYGVRYVYRRFFY